MGGFVEKSRGVLRESWGLFLNNGRLFCASRVVLGDSPRVFTGNWACCTAFASPRCVYIRRVFVQTAFDEKHKSLFSAQRKEKCVRGSATTEIGGERKILSVSGAHEIGTEATA